MFIMNVWGLQSESRLRYHEQVRKAVEISRSFRPQLDFYVPLLIGLINSLVLDFLSFTRDLSVIYNVINNRILFLFYGVLAKEGAIKSFAIGSEMTFLRN